MFGLIAAMAKRKNKMKADKENVPAQKRQKHEEPWASASEHKEKGDTHKWAYATKSYFEITPLQKDPKQGELRTSFGGQSLANTLGLGTYGGQSGANTLGLGTYGGPSGANTLGLGTYGVQSAANTLGLGT